MANNVGDLLVRLLGNNEQLKQTFTDSKDQAGQLKDHVEDVASGVQTAMDGITFMGLKQQFETLFAGLKNTYGDFLNSFMESEDVEIGLAAAIRAGGRSAEDVMPIYQAYAAQMMELTRLDDEQVLGLLKRAETFGLSGQAAISAANDAIGLAEAADSSAEAMIRLTAKMVEGDVKGAMLFSRMVPQLRGVKTELEFIDKYQRLVNNGLDEAALLGSSSAGQLDELADSWGNLKEELGGLIARVLLPIVEALQNVVDWFNKLDPKLRDFLMTMVLVGLGMTALTITTNLLRAAWAYLTLSAGGLLGVMTKLAEIGVITVGINFVANHEGRREIVNDIERMFGVDEGSAMGGFLDGLFGVDRKQFQAGRDADVPRRGAAGAEGGGAGGLSTLKDNFQPTRFRSNLTEEERQFLSLQAGRNMTAEEQMVEEIEDLVEIQEEALEITRRMEQNSIQFNVASFA